ncbi:MAG: CoA transferase [Gammaproteobacteria bacterium]|nr:CoA transferase [Gammaproteobacteria bacterium]MBT5602615.1 CoA transferase [Gammaproteobacteria bacterium]MBT6244217.1 CoA transferase [Gammaproteobacteria bacterium]
MASPLDNITVIEIDNWMAAPSAGAILADMGARVIKIEPPVGDPMRDMGRTPKVDSSVREIDLQFDVDNRGKESLVVDLSQQSGIEIVHKLCQTADIFMCNLLLERQQKYRLDSASLFAINPKLVHATLTGFGTTGPDAWRPGYDVTAFFGRSGLYDAMREGDDGDVPQARPAQGDHTTGLALVAGILAALRQAESSGEGQTIETSLYETAVWTQASDYATTANDLAPVRKRARRNLLTPTANRYPCGDGKWVVFNMPGPEQWPAFCVALGLSHWLEEDKYATGKGRYDHMPELTDGVDQALARRNRDEWGPIFDDAGLIWGPVLGLHEVPSDPQAKAINLFPTMHNEEFGEYKTVGIPIRFGQADVRPRHSAPRLGQNSTAILQELGMDKATIQALIQKGVVNPL